MSPGMSREPRGSAHENQPLATPDQMDESGLKSRACFSGAWMGVGSMHPAESFLTLFTSVLTGWVAISSG